MLFRQALWLQRINSIISDNFLSLSHLLSLVTFAVMKFLFLLSFENLSVPHLYFLLSDLDKVITRSLLCFTKSLFQKSSTEP
jgi:hypothetical protein